MTTVSVIIPNYNHAQFLTQRIESVLNQTWQQFELIILDDHSTDDSKKIIEHYKDHPKVKQVIFNSVNSGSSFKQWQKGIALATGQYVWIAESDDYCEEHFLNTAIESLTTSGSALFFCQSYLVDDNNTIKGDYADPADPVWKNSFTINGREFIFKYMQFGNAIVNASAVVFKNKPFDFDNVINYKTCGDWLFWINFLHSDNASISYCHQKLNYFRSHTATTRNFDNAFKQVQRVTEESSVAYYLLKKGIITKKQFHYIFNRKMDGSLAHFSLYKQVCGQLKLPDAFLAYFIRRRLQLKLLRTRSSIKNILKKAYRKVHPLA